jgi:hypothetical protein
MAITLITFAQFGRAIFAGSGPAAFFTKMHKFHKRRIMRSLFFGHFRKTQYDFAHEIPPNFGTAIQCLNPQKKFYW